MKAELTRLTVEAFLNEVAERRPTPGGGSVAALAGALACALARMVAAYSVSPKTEPAVRAAIERFARRLRTADEMLRALILEDAAAYTALTDAARSAKEGAADESARRRALLAALTVPMEIAAAASNLLAVMDEFKELASRNLLSDLGVAAALAEGSAQAAYFTALVNVRELDDVVLRAKLIGDLAQITEHVRERSGRVQVYVRGHLESPGEASR